MDADFVAWFVSQPGNKDHPQLTSPHMENAKRYSLIDMQEAWRAAREAEADARRSSELRNTVNAVRASRRNGRPYG